MQRRQISQKAPARTGQRRRHSTQVIIADPPPFCGGVAADREIVQAGDPVIFQIDLIDAGLAAFNHTFLDLRFTWTSTAGHVIGLGMVAVLLTHDMAAGEHWVTAEMSDGYGHTVQCSGRVTIRVQSVS